MAPQKNETRAPTGPRILHSPQKELHTLSLGDAESIYWLLTLLLGACRLGMRLRLPSVSMFS